MRSFLEEVIVDLKEKYESFEDIVFVLPNRRAGTFLKHLIARYSQASLFAPDIYSIEQFVEVISGLSYATPTEQLFELYQAYLDIGAGEKESFLEFSKWAGTLLSDFDEIDRYLIPHQKVFSYLADINEVNHWYVQKERTRLMEDYIRFWNSLHDLYNGFRERLLIRNRAHQGLVYRMAYEGIKTYLDAYNDRIFIFLGFNALNEAESQIIQAVLNRSESRIYWDVDQYFLDEKYHDAGLFIRRHKNTWKYLQDEPLVGITSHFQTPKSIQITGVPKHISQAKFIGTLLEKIQDENGGVLENTALVLGDESLLNPILNSLPSLGSGVNITMGFPLNNTTLNGMFARFIELYAHRDSKGWYYKKVLDFLSQPHIEFLLSRGAKDVPENLRLEIQNKNLNFLTIDFLQSYLGQDAELLFNPLNYQTDHLLKSCTSLVDKLRLSMENSPSNTMEMEHLYCFHTIFNQLSDWNQQFPHIKDVATIQALYRELLSQEKIDFQGEPLEGLQIMGMLESRQLDFETVIISSVNEGILPAGKTGNSFIPYDVKKELGLPTFKEKDAVYTYHFYRLLQRAKKVYILYNTEPDVLIGGEPSRLIHQLRNDGKVSDYVRHQLATSGVHPADQAVFQISKNEQLLASIENIAQKGFSPTSLSQYIRDPLEFYKKTVLKIADSPSVDETVDPRNMGIIIHNSLEELYQPFAGKFLERERLEDLKPSIESVVRTHFTQFYDESALYRGQHYLAYRVIVRYLMNFVNHEILELGDKQIKLLGLELDLSMALELAEIPFPVRLRGKIDRVDEVNGRIRILDYKTGKVELSDMNLVDWEEIISDPKRDKAFQVLCYALLFNEYQNTDTMEAGIVSFRNLDKGFLSFGTKETKQARKRNPVIDQEILRRFRSELHSLILEICNKSIPIEEKIS